MDKIYFKNIKHQRQAKITRNYKVTSEKFKPKRKNKSIYATFTLRMFVNPKNQDLCFDNIAQNVGTEIKIRHLHKGISSSELV